MTFDRDWIARNIPHRERMCLLDRVAAWDAAHVVCHATSHRDPANPLRAHGRLGSACGVEYAAQAMALHGALLAPPENAPRIGYLTSIRDLVFAVTRLDDVGADLHVEAHRQAGDGNNVLYRFVVRGDGRELLRGRAAVVLDAERLGRRPGTKR